MSLDDLFNVSITAQTVYPTRPGFGTPMLLAYHTHYVDRVRTYTSLAGMVSDGFTTTEPAYLAATVAFSQNPRVPKLKIGRRRLPFTQVVALKCLNATQGYVYNFSHAGHAITYTVPGSATTTTVATAIAALINAAVGGSTAVASVDTITVTEAAGVLRDFKGWDVAALHFADTTTDPGLATDLAEINAADPDWYGLCLDSQSPAEIAAGASWCEANVKIFSPNTSDTDCADGTKTTDIMYTLKTSAYARTSAWFAGTQLLSYLGTGIMCNRLPDDPGSDTWSYKTIPGVVSDVLTETQYNAIEAKNGNAYVPTNGVNITLFGKCAGGEWMDVTRFLDWLHAGIQFNLLGLAITSKKIPFTDAGADQVGAQVMAALKAGTVAPNPGLVANPPPTVSYPKVKDVSPTDKANRNLPAVIFNAQLSGAIHTSAISGTVTV